MNIIELDKEVFIIERFISVEPNVMIYVNDINSSGEKTFLFLHGWPLSQNAYEYQYNELTQKGYRCIGIDTRGFGKSSKPYSGYDYNRLSDDVRVVIDTLKLRDITLVGHSTGGAIAVRYMSRHQAFGVTKLVLLSAAVPSLIQRPYFPYGLPKEAVEDIIKGTYNDRPLMLRNFGDQLFYKTVSQPLKDWIFLMGLPASSIATSEIAKTWIADEKLFTDVTQIKTPTLILHGVPDKVCLYPLALAQNKMIQNSKLVSYQHSGHGLFIEDHDEVNKELIKFINQ